jgi:glucose/arabinose dehydrogenase
MRRALAAVAVAAAVALAGCAGSDQQSTAPEETPSASPTEQVTEESPSQSPSESPSQSPSEDSPDAIEVEIEGDRIKPNGKRVEVPMGEPVALHVKSDRAAELHVHSSPEQVVTVKKGESTVRFTVKTPGVVDVEEHETGIVILQLEVS